MFLPCGFIASFRLQHVGAYRRIAGLEKHVDEKLVSISEKLIPNSLTKNDV